MSRAARFVLILSLIASSARAWQSQFFPFNAGAGKYVTQTVTVGGKAFTLPDFSYAGYKLSERGLGDGIPCLGVTLSATTNEDIAPKLNQAVTTLAAAGGGTVYIPAGTFLIGSRVTVNADNIRIQGAGSAFTNLTVPASYPTAATIYEGAFLFTGNASNIAQWILQSRCVTSTAVSADVALGAMSVQATNASIFVPGDWVVVQQFFWAAFSAATSASTWPLPPFSSQADREYSSTYLRKVVSVVGNQVNLDAPIPRALQTANAAITIYKPSPADYSENLGLEGVTLYTAPRATADLTSVMFKGVFNGWCRDVKLLNFGLHGFQPQWAARVTFLDCATDTAQYIGGGGQGYSYHINASQEMLVRRCSSTNVRHNITTQKPMCSDVVFSRMDDSSSTQQDDTHHSYAHNILWDMLYQHGGVGLSATNRGTTSTNGYETFAGGVVWNHHGDGVTTGGWQAGRIQIRPDNYLPGNLGFVIGNWGGHRVYDNSTDINSSYVNGPEVTGSALQVSARANVVYEGVNTSGLQPASLFEEQLTNRAGSLPPDVAPAACGGTPTFTGTRTATSTASPTMTATRTATASPSATATGTPSATSTTSPSPSSSATLTGTRTRTPLSSATPTATPTRTPSASPTSTPLGAWGAEKALDAFKATAQFYTSFQPGAAGSSLGLVVDSGAGNFVEGSEAVRADISFNGSAGFAELLRGYGTQTLDLSQQPFGLSIWVKGTVPSDTVQLMLYEDQNMNGSPYDAGDEVWASPAQAISGSWTKLVVPFSAFTLYAGSGNAALDLNRVFAWRLVINNGTSSAHSAQVWFDDLRQLTLRTPAADNAAVLSGSFIQLWNAGTGCGCGGWSQAQWDAELQKLKDLCQDTVFVQYGAWEDNAWYTPESQAFINFSNPTLGRIFTAAENLGMKVVVGLWFGESWNTDDKTLAATYSTPLARSTGVANEIALLFGSSPAFGGWYIPQEVNDLEWPTGSPQLTLLRNWLRDTAAAAKAAKNAPVYLAPYFGPNRPADDYQSWWDGTLAVATGIDVLIPQDGVGTTRTDADVDVPAYYAAIKAAALGRGRSFGATVESFQQTDGWPINGNAFAAVPAGIGRFKSQLWEAQAAGATTLIQFEYPYMQAGRGAAFAQLYTDYQAYQQAEAPCAMSPTPTRTPSPSASLTPSATPSGTGSASPTSTASATPTLSATASFTPSITPSATPSLSVTASITLTVTPSASFTQTFTAVPPGSTLTSTLTPSLTASSTPTLPNSATPSVSASSTPLPTNTATPSVGIPATTFTRTVTPSVTTSVTPSVTGTVASSATNTPVSAPAASATPATGDGTLQILACQGAPNPDPVAIAIRLNGPADQVELRLYSPGMTLLAKLSVGPLPGGWSQVPLPSEWVSAAPHGLSFVTAQAKRQAQRSLPFPPSRVFRLQ